MRIDFTDTSLIYDFVGQELEPGTFIERQLPPQFASEGEAKVFGSIEDAFQTYETGSFSSDVLINAMIAGSLQVLWAMVPSQ